MSLRFCSLSSGSSGNCYYIGTEFHGILIDAGISATSVRKFLAARNISLQSIMGVFVSHNHSDHIKGLEVLTRKFHIPAFTTRDIWQSILTPRSRITSDCIHEIPLREAVHIAGIDIEAFPVCHDAPQTLGFQVNSGGKIITIVTDLGHICETSAHYIKNSNLLVIESNYDEEMLIKGGYPWYLKKRIQSDHGHLGNKQASEFIAGIVNDGLTHICLAHLSRNNNTPDKALGTLNRMLQEKGITHCGEISVLNRHLPTEIIVI